MSAARRDERGFVLIGVVMFVLALTILGISLFGLSSFEAQFYQQAESATRAFYDASAGLEHARFVLAQRGWLKYVTYGSGAPLPYPDSVVYMKAWYRDAQDRDSLGEVQWSGSRVFIRSRAVVNGQACLLQCSYTPSQLRNPYVNLITTTGGVAIDPGALGLTIQMAGTVWQASRNTAWADAPQLQWQPRTLDLSVGVPIPGVQRFTYAHPSGITPDYISHGHTRPQYAFAASAVYSGTTNPDALQDPRYGLHDPSSTAGLGPILNVGGNAAIWLLPGGACFDYPVQVQGDSASGGRLVMVASCGTDDAVPGMPPIGFWFKGGLASSVPVILVTDGTVSLDARNATLPAASVSWLSIFAGGVYLGATGTFQMGLSHRAGGDGILDPLIRQGLLPNTDPTETRLLVQAPGSWSQITDSHPPEY